MPSGRNNAYRQLNARRLFTEAALLALTLALIVVDLGMGFPASLPARSWRRSSTDRAENPPMPPYYGSSVCP